MKRSPPLSNILISPMLPPTLPAPLGPFITEFAAGEKKAESSVAARDLAVISEVAARYLPLTS